MLDETVKTILVDESLTVVNLVASVCGKIGKQGNKTVFSSFQKPASDGPSFSSCLFPLSPGITNSDEYSFTTESNEAKAARPQGNTESKGPHFTLTPVLSLPRLLLCLLAIWLNPDKTLHEQGVDDNEVVVLKKFFFSDQNVDRTDPIQLNLLYVQVC